jgi:leucyl/phenylalanyl-tRNA--protein transferase
MVKFLRNHPFEVSCDTDFRGVIQACADTPREGQHGTWITADMIEAYCKLHDMGIAHCFECRQDGVLVGGIYGVSLGAAFFGESMFSHRTNASKTAFGALASFAETHGFHFIDCQNESSHLATLGANLMPRGRFLALLDKALEAPTLQGKWPRP